MQISRKICINYKLNQSLTYRNRLVDRPWYKVSHFSVDKGRQIVELTSRRFQVDSGANWRRQFHKVHGPHRRIFRRSRLRRQCIDNLLGLYFAEREFKWQKVSWIQLNGSKLSYSSWRYGVWLLAIVRIHETRNCRRSRLICEVFKKSRTVFNRSEVGSLSSTVAAAIWTW